MSCAFSIKLIIQINPKIELRLYVIGPGLKLISLVFEYVCHTIGRERMRTSCRTFDITGDSSQSHRCVLLANPSP